MSLVVALADGASTVTLSYDGVAQGALPVVMEQYRQSNWSVLVGLNYIVVSKVVSNQGITRLNHEDYGPVPDFAIPEP